MTADQILAKIITNTLQVGTELVNEVPTPVYIEPSRVVLENQEAFIAPSKGLLILISFANQQPYAFARNYQNFENNTKLKEVLTKTFYTTFAVELLSKDTSAIEYQEKLLLFLNSYKSKELQEQYNVSIQTANSSWASLSFLEGASRNYRFRIAINMYHGISIESEVPTINTININNSSQL